MFDQNNSEAGYPRDSYFWYLTRPSFLIAVLLVGAQAVFGQVAWFGFNGWDDPVYVSQNPVVLSGLGWEQIQWAFSTKYFGLWHPLAWLSHMTDVSIWGTWAGGHHLTNVFFHVGATGFLLLFLLESGICWPRAFLIAFLFSLHPLRAESVAWISERKDVLCLFWLMICLWAHGRWSRDGGKALFALAHIACLMAILSKPLAVVAPVLLLLADRWPLARPARIPTLLVEKSGYAALALFGVYMAFANLAGEATIASPQDAVITIHGLDRIWHVGNAIWVYVYSSIWPVGMALFHPIKWDSLAFDGIRGLSFLALLLWLIYSQWTRRPWVSVGIGWYLVALAPGSGIVQISNFAYADRYSYLPSIGLAMAVVMSLPSPSQNPIRRLLQLSTLATLLLTMTVLSAWQVSHWRSSYALYQRALAIDPDNHVAHLKIAEHYLANGQLFEAEQHVLRAETPHEGSNYQVARLGMLGRIAYQRRDFETAKTAWHKALALQPDARLVHFDLGTLALFEMDNPRALYHFETASHSLATSTELWTNYGVALGRASRWAEAETAYRRAVLIDPFNASAWLNLARIHENHGRLAEAQDIYQRVLAIYPDNSQARAGIGRTKSGPK